MIFCCIKLSNTSIKKLKLCIMQRKIKVKVDFLAHMYKKCSKFKLHSSSNKCHQVIQFSSQLGLLLCQRTEKICKCHKSQQNVNCNGFKHVDNTFIYSTLFIICSHSVYTRLITLNVNLNQPSYLTYPDYLIITQLCY